mgnify:CR=1 FL=1
MAIRYSGDVEVRVLYTRGVYKGSVRAPGFNCHGTLTSEEARVRTKAHSSPEAYDQAAKSFLMAAISLAKRMDKHLHLYPEFSGKKLVVRRTFQSPCPYRV